MAWYFESLVAKSLQKLLTFDLDENANTVKSYLLLKLHDLTFWMINLFIDLLVD